MRALCDEVRDLFYFSGILSYNWTAHFMGFIKVIISIYFLGEGSRNSNPRGVGRSGRTTRSYRVRNGSNKRRYERGREEFAGNGKMLWNLRTPVPQVCHEG